ncbi:MAG: phosphatidylglycerophosphatase A [Desulfobacterales bacterium]|nr:phosphatidylglycerophosphatase A [Desulfobacterales bacterium]
MKLKQKVVIFLATGCFIGKIPIAPGTFGSALGLPLCFLLSGTDFLIAILLTTLFIVFSIWIAQNAEKLFQTKDPGCIVIDEIAGFMVTLMGLPFNITSIFMGFIIFRFLDILKPFPIRFVEKRFSGGRGIVLDDVTAGIMGNFILRIIFHYTGTI